MRLIALFAFCGLALAQSAQITQSLNQRVSTTPFGLVVPDHIRFIERIARLFADLAPAIIALAGMVAFVGFVKRHWERYLLSDEPGYIRLWLLSGIYVALISASYSGSLNFRSMMLSSWKGAYVWADNRYGSRLQASMQEATDALGEAVGRVIFAGGMVVGTRAAIEGTFAAAQVSIPAMADAAIVEGTTPLAVGGAAVAQSLKSGLSRGAAASLRYLGLAQQFVLPLLTAYSLTIILSALAAVVAAYFLPLGIAALFWGYSNILVACISVFLTALFSIALLPAMASISLDIAFVEPIKSVERYTRNLDNQAQQARELSNRVIEQMKNATAQELDACIAAASANPEALNQSICQTQGGRGIGFSLSGTLRRVWLQTWGAIDAALTPIRDALILALGSLLMLLVGMVMGVVFLIQAPNVIGNVFGAGIGGLSSAWRASSIGGMWKR
jgi:hypothetical protein